MFAPIVTSKSKIYLKIVLYISTSQRDSKYDMKLPQSLSITYKTKLVFHLILSRILPPL